MDSSIKTLFFISIVIAAGIAALIWYVDSHGFSAKSTPNGAEAYVARNLRRLAIPAHAREAQNPVAASPDTLPEAMEHFADHCATCHGNDGSGRSHIGSGLYPPPPDMALAGTQSLTDGELYYIIENGVRFTGMPGFGAVPADEHDEATWKLVRFIRHLPQITDDEVALMTTMNPKSPTDIANEEKINKFLQGEEDSPVEHSSQHHH